MGEESKERSGKGIEVGGGGDEGKRGQAGEREIERGRNKNKVRKEKSTEHELNTQKPNQPKQRVESCGGKCF